jgi:serine phosphatase RsbU (regulator of sigma subunit)
MGLMGFVIADVSDKGVPAAMFMALSRSLVRAAALDGSPPPQAIERANRWITRDSESGMFVTLFYGVLDPQSGRLRYTVAGHNPPIHYRAADGTMAELRTPGIALGVLEEIKLGEAQTELAPGDVLVCYTDGVTETIDDANQEYGVERLRNLIASHHGAPAEAIVRAIIDAVSHHGHGRPPFDDITLVVIKREPVIRDP